MIEFWEHSPEELDALDSEPLPGRSSVDRRHRLRHSDRKALTASSIATSTSHESRRSLHRLAVSQEMNAPRTTIVGVALVCLALPLGSQLLADGRSEVTRSNATPGRTTGTHWASPASFARMRIEYDFAVRSVDARRPCEWRKELDAAQSQGFKLIIGPHIATRTRDPPSAGAQPAPSRRLKPQTMSSAASLRSPKKLSRCTLIVLAAGALVVPPLSSGHSSDHPPPPAGFAVVSGDAHERDLELGAGRYRGLLQPVQQRPLRRLHDVLGVHARRARVRSELRARR